jgi:DNA-directed RNA polymerase specialized sigma24 family protein
LTPNEWLTLNYSNLRQAAHNISNRDSLAEDLLSECILIFLQKPNAQIIVDSGGALYFIVRIMLNQWKSTSSPFHKQYRRTYAYELDNEIAQSIEDNSELENAMMAELSTLNWYSRTLFELNTFEEESISQISRQTKIPRASITMEIKRVKQHLRAKAQNFL